MESYDAKLGRGCRLRGLLAYVRPLATSPPALPALARAVDAGTRARFLALAARHRQHGHVL
jgi:hypothetical protein